MNDISIALPNPCTSARHMPMIMDLGDNLCYYYGIGLPRGCDVNGLPIKKLRTTKIPTRASRYLLSPLYKILKKPEYYVYLSKIVILDMLVARKISKDESKIVLTHALMKRTVHCCKKKGKIVVLEAANAESKREYNRISKEYSLYNIKKKYIYGDVRFCTIATDSFNQADYIITISKVSEKTYKDANYDMSKMVFISLAGTDWEIRDDDKSYVGKQKAFICSAFQNFIKGTHRLLLAYRESGITDIPLIVSGKMCEDMVEFVSKYGPFNNVHFIGYQDSLKELYGSYDAVGVLMSLSEGAVRTTPEMMSYGFPMIVSPDATCDVVIDGINGFVVPYDDTEKIVNRLRWFAEDWERVHSMRETVLSSVRNRKMKDYSIELGNFLKSLV